MLLVKGQEFAEIIEHHAANGATFVLFPDGRDDCGYMAELLADGHVPVKAIKVIKPDGTWVYIGDAPVTPRNPNGTAVFSRGGVFV